MHCSFILGASRISGFLDCCHLLFKQREAIFLFSGKGGRGGAAGINSVVSDNMRPRCGWLQYLALVT